MVRVSVTAFYDLERIIYEMYLIWSFCSLCSSVLKTNQVVELDILMIKITYTFIVFKCKYIDWVDLNNKDIEALKSGASSKVGLTECIDKAHVIKSRVITRVTYPHVKA